MTMHLLRQRVLKCQTEWGTTPASATYSDLEFRSFARTIRDAPARNGLRLLELIARDARHRADLVRQDMLDTAWRLAEASDLARPVGEARVQQVLATAFRGPRAPTEYDGLSNTSPLPAARLTRNIASGRKNRPAKRATDAPQLAASTIAAINYLIKEKDCEGLTRFVKSRPQQQRGLIERHIARKRGS